MECFKEQQLQHILRMQKLGGELVVRMLTPQHTMPFFQDFRIYKVAKYTENFIPVSTNSNILSDAPSGVATKSKLKKITDGSVSFDGTSNTLATYVSSSDFTFGTGDFTIEMFLYNEETAGKGFIQFSDSSGGLKNTFSGVVTIHKDAGQNVEYLEHMPKMLPLLFQTQFHIRGGVMLH